jgi:hypothetical protein
MRRAFHWQRKVQWPSKSFAPLAVKNDDVKKSHPTAKKPPAWRNGYRRDP